MSLLFTDGFEHYTEAEILSKWSSGTPFALVPGLGRLGSPAAVVDTALGVACRVDLTPHAVSGLSRGLAGSLFLCGFALRPITMPVDGSPVVLCSVQVTVTSGTAPEGFYLVLYADGHLEIRRGPGNPLVNLSAPSLDPGYVCTTPAGVIDLARITPDDDSVPYVEWAVRFDALVQPETRIAVKGQGEVANAYTEFATSLTTRQKYSGTTINYNGGTFVGFTLGDARNPAGVRFAVADLYILDGYPGDDHVADLEQNLSWEYTWGTGTPRIIDYASFLGDTKIDLALPLTGENQGSGPNPTPWTPTGAADYGHALKGRLPADTGPYVEADTLGQIDAAPYVFWALPWPGLPFANNIGDAPLFAIMRWFRAWLSTGSAATLTVIEQIPGSLAAGAFTSPGFAGALILDTTIRYRGRAHLSTFVGYGNAIPGNGAQQTIRDFYPDASNDSTGAQALGEYGAQVVALS